MLKWVWVVAVGALLSGCMGHDVGNSAQPGGENTPPEWQVEDKLELEICYDKEFEIDLGKFVVDADGDLLKFGIEGAPAFAELTELGKFSGEPIGITIFSEFEFRIFASDGQSLSWVEAKATIVGCRRRDGG